MQFRDFFFDAQNHTRSPMASAISWIFVRVETKFSPNDTCVLKLCCIKICHYFDKVCTWKSRVDAWLSFYAEFIQVKFTTRGK